MKRSRPEAAKCDRTGKQWMSYVIQGEKVFTEAARRKAYRAFMCAADKKYEEVDQLKCIARKMLGARTVGDLEKSGALNYDAIFDLRPYLYDDRITCHYCKRKVDSGIRETFPGREYRFSCWQASCRYAQEAEVAESKKAHPKWWKARARWKARQHKWHRSKR